MPASQPDTTRNLRRRAEDMTLLNNDPVANIASYAEMQRSLHELQVHQIELGMQNDEMCRMQHDLEISQARYFELFDLAPVGYCTLTATGLILEANLTAAALLGIERTSLVKQYIRRFILEEDLHIHSMHCSRLIESGEPQSSDLRMVKSDGTPFWAHLKATVSKNVSSLVPDADDATVFHLILSDISWRKQAESEMQKKNAEMEQFIYTVSHDLRSPLVTIKTFMGFLEKDMAEDNQENLVQDIRFIHGATDKMKLLLDELLEMSRIGRVEAKPVLVPLREIVAEALETLAGPISEREIHIQLPETELILSGDRHRLYQVWQNLIENSIKYSSDDVIPRIEIGTRQLSDELVFFVKDNGIGINPQYHSRIFGIFDKLDPRSPGAGLGLSMVLRIVEKNGGRIWVESEGTGTGSCFCFTLPATKVPN